MRQEKIGCEETKVRRTVQFTIQNTFTGKTRVKWNDDHVDPGDEPKVVKLAVGEPLHIWLEGAIPETIPIMIKNYSTSGSADNYTSMINRYYDEVNKTPKWQIILTGPGYAKDIVSRTAANVTVGDGEPPDTLGGES